VVDSHRGVVAQRRFASQILPSVSIDEKTFTRWLQHLAGEEAARKVGHIRRNCAARSAVRSGRRDWRDAKGSAIA